jgi:hypothetical protein
MPLGELLEMKTLQTGFGSIVALALLVCLSSCERAEDKAQLKEAAERGEQSYRLYRSGDYAAGKTALLDYIHYLEGKLADPSFVHIESSKVDIMLSYARLARLEERNNGPEREAYMQKAVAMCEQLQIKRKCSPLDMAAQVDVADLMLSGR